MTFPFTHTGTQTNRNRENTCPQKTRYPWIPVGSLFCTKFSGRQEEVSVGDLVQRGILVHIRRSLVVTVLNEFPRFLLRPVFRLFGTVQGPTVHDRWSLRVPLYAFRLFRPSYPKKIPLYSFSGFC